MADGERSQMRIGDQVTGGARRRQERAQRLPMIVILAHEPDHIEREPPVDDLDGGGRW
jgi:hypothetical protein